MPHPCLGIDECDPGVKEVDAVFRGYGSVTSDYRYDASGARPLRETRRR